MEDIVFSRRERKKIKSQQEIINAALRLFRTKGYDSTNIDEIAEAADVSKSTFYNYFSSKEAVLHGIAEDSYFDTNAALNRFPARDGIEKLRFLLTFQIWEAMPYVDIARRIVMANATLNGDSAKTMNSLSECCAEEAMQQGLFRKGVSIADITSMTRGIYYNAIFNWPVDLTREEYAEMSSRAFDILLEGISNKEEAE